MVALRFEGDDLDALGLEVAAKGARIADAAEGHDPAGRWYRPSGGVEETDPAVRVVLGHFIFVYIHPYIDGNGRMGRFLMNVMLAGGGYPWTIIPVEKRDDYMQSLEAASVEQNIKPFSEFLATLVRDNLEGKLGPKVPAS